MKKFTIIAIVFLILTSSLALACGSWEFEDLEANTKIRFKTSGVELIDTKRADPEFMQSSREGAFFTQGDRLKLINEDKIRLSKLSGKTTEGKRKFTSSIIASISKGVLKLNDETSYDVTLSTDRKSIQVKDRNHKLVGQANIEKFQECERNREAQLYRVAYYLVWKSLRLDPFAPKVENWWW